MRSPDSVLFLLIHDSLEFIFVLPSSSLFDTVLTSLSLSLLSPTHHSLPQVFCTHKFFVQDIIEISEFSLEQKKSRMKFIFQQNHIEEKTTSYSEHLYKSFFQSYDEDQEKIGDQKIFFSS